MKTIIAGSRGITDYDIVDEAIREANFNITAVVSGTARGVDQLGEEWAKLNNIPIVEYPAEWSTYGKSAGVRRNNLMAENAEALIAIWDGKSRGTKHMIQVAKNKNLTVFVYELD